MTPRKDTETGEIAWENYRLKDGESRKILFLEGERCRNQGKQHRKRKIESEIARKMRDRKFRKRAFKNDRKMMILGNTVGKYEKRLENQEIAFKIRVRKMQILKNSMKLEKGR